MIFENIKSITIPEGEVKQIVYNGTILWEKISRYLKTITGKIITITDALNEPAESLKVTLEPIQSGSGTPSPDNPRPISGWTEVVTIVSPTTDAEDGISYTTALGRTVYGGTLDVVSGELNVTMGYIASYNGETLPSTWISDRDEYASGITPTIGAEVAYTLATPQTYQLTAQEIELLHGNNNVWSDGSVEVTYWGTEQSN